MINDYYSSIREKELNMSPPHILTVVIPYYQIEKGILERALNSVQAQDIPSGWQIEVIIVDDGSPHPARDELKNVIFGDPFQIKLIEQENGGVAVARNQGLDNVDTNSAFLAFLDSDDVWPQKHLRNAIDAFDLGYDLVFSDNKRFPHHESYIRKCAPETFSIIESLDHSDGLYDISGEQLPMLIIKEFPSHISSLLFRRSVAPDVRFHTKLEVCGEDILFIVSVLSLSERICFNARSIVECGDGINIYFGHFSWDDQKLLAIKRGQIAYLSELQRMSNLPKLAVECNSILLRNAWNDFAFHSLRRLIKQRGKIPKEVITSIQQDEGFFKYFPLGLFYTAVGKAVGFYKP